MDKKQFEALLTPPFTKKHVDAALDHFSGAVANFQSGDWEQCIAKAGKYVEATIKMLGTYANLTMLSGRRFSAGTVMDDLGRMPATAADDTVRITTPRACRFVYDIASNRGARHDPDEIDPNEMDAAAVVPVCSWILAEMIRFAQKGVIDTAQAQEFVESLSARRYPLVEEIDGRVYFHHPKKKSARDVALLALAYRHPKRVAEKDLVATIKRHGFKANNATTAVGRIRNVVDADGNGNLRLLTSGLEEAESLMKQDVSS